MDMKAAVDRLASNLGAEVVELLRRRLRQAVEAINARGFRRRKRATLWTGYAYGNLKEYFDWDLYFDNIFFSYLGESRYCRNNLEAFLDEQLACGFVSRTLLEPRARQHFKPFLCQIALLGSRQTGDYRWLKGRYFERLRKYLDYWFWYCDFDRNGLPVWDSADHTGMDNQGRRGGVMNAMEVEGVDLACYLTRELEAFAILAGKVGEPEASANANQHAAELKGLINQVFWHEGDGFYYDRNERSDEPVRVKSVAGLIPLWLGIVPTDRAERLVTQHLLNAEEFWLPYPVATWAKAEPDYYQGSRRGECNWRGPAWVPTNYMIFHGLEKSGYRDRARELAYRTFEMVMGEPDTREYYNAETGSGLGQNPFLGWSLLAYAMPLEYELGYDPTDIGREHIVPILSQALDIEF